MTGFDINLQGDGAWPDLYDKGVTLGDLHAVALLDNGTREGKHAVMFRVNTPDGNVVTCQTTLALLVAAVRALQARAEMQGQSFE